MQRIGKISSVVSACFLAAAALTGATPASAAGSLKAAYVEQVIPSRTFASQLIMAGNSPVSDGPGTGILGISSLTFTNYADTQQQVFIFTPVYPAGGRCGDPIAGGTTPRQQLYLQPHSTLHLAYPTPWVISVAGGATCIAAEVTTSLNGGSVEMDVNGVVN